MRMTTLVTMMMMMGRDFLDSGGAFVLGASGQVDLGVSIVTLSMMGSSSSSSFCKMVYLLFLPLRLVGFFFLFFFLRHFRGKGFHRSQFESF